MSAQWYRDDEVLAAMPRKEAIAHLESIGETDLALRLKQAARVSESRATSFGLFDALSSTPKPWMHTSHVFGFLPRKAQDDSEPQILAPGEIQPDKSLLNGRINVTLSRLRIAEYPGAGRRQILFDFSGQNHLPGGTEDAHFSMVFRAEQNAMVGVINYPIFIGMHVGLQSTVLRCFTVNVQNDEDEKLMSALDSEVFKKGLKFATVAQPALAPLAELTVGLTRAVASRHRNVPVQNVQMGLDFGGPRLGARLAQGDYIAVQVPMQALSAWDWSEYRLNTKVGEIVRTDGTPIPYNYFAFGISAYQEGVP